MNINSNYLSVFSSVFVSFKEQISFSLTDQQKRIIVIASLVFAAMGICYAILRFLKPQISYLNNAATFDEGKELALLKKQTLPTELILFKKHYDLEKKKNSSLTDIDAEMQKLFAFAIPEKYEQIINKTLFEINVVLRHPATVDKAEVFRAIAKSLSQAKDQSQYINHLLYLDDYTDSFHAHILGAEMKYGLEYKDWWPKPGKKYDGEDSSQVQFMYKGPKA